jgi:hypothetical protein
MITISTQRRSVNFSVFSEYLSPLPERTEPRGSMSNWQHLRDSAAVWQHLD